jgi:hypothetical protein
MILVIITDFKKKSRQEKKQAVENFQRLAVVSRILLIGNDEAYAPLA